LLAKFEQVLLSHSGKNSFKNSWISFTIWVITKNLIVCC